ncbi:MAG: hypothetical protein QXR19_12775 [Candidatus Jordarchaeaceae archaeon]
MSYRPRGVIVLAILFFVFCALGIVWGIYLELTATAENNTSIMSLYILHDTIIELIRVDSNMLFLVIALISSVSSMINDFYSFAALSMIISNLYFLAGVGLFMMRRWGRKLAVILGILNIVGGIFLLALFIVFGVVPLVFGTIVLVYLTGEVKYDFE